MEIPAKAEGSTKTRKRQMTRSKRLTAILLTAVATLAIGGCHTTVVEPAQKHDLQQAHRDDHHDDRNQPQPQAPDHGDDRR